MPKTVKISEFKAKCLALIDAVAETGEELIITKYGRPLGKLIPYATRPRTLFGAHRGRIRSHDDLIAPIGESWQAET